VCIPKAKSEGTYYYPVYLPDVELECCLVHNSASTSCWWSLFKDDIEYEDDNMIEVDDFQCKYAYNNFRETPWAYLTINIQDPDPYRECTLMVFSTSGDVPAFTFYYRLTGEYTPVGSEE